jgi:ABC-type nitrate/sulfonate/bicarbonate transport system permease component
MTAVESARAPETAERPARWVRSARRVAGRWLAGAAPIVALVAIWWVVAPLLGRERVYPPPDVVFAALAEIVRGNGELGSTYTHIAATFARLAAAFAVSMLVGVLTGILAGRVRMVFSLVENLVWVFMAVPSIVWVFIFAVALGITNVVPVAAMAALLTPMILVNVAEGAKSVPADIVEMSRSYKVTAWQRLTGVFLPFLVPFIASSARTAFALGVKLVVVAEVVGLASGIGYELNYWYDRLFMGPVIAWGIVMIVIGLLVDYGVFGPLERKVGRWRERPSVDVRLGGAE